MTPSRDIRATPQRIAELREEMAEREGRLHARIDQLEDEVRNRDEFGRRLAHNLAIAITDALKGSPAPAPTRPREITL